MVEMRHIDRPVPFDGERFRQSGEVLFLNLRWLTCCAKHACPFCTVFFTSFMHDEASVGLLGQRSACGPDSWWLG